MYVVEHDEIRNGLRCVTIFTELGHRCGYVGIKKTHPLFGKEYNEDLPPQLQERREEVMSGPVGKRGVFDIFMSAMGEAKHVGILFDVHGSITYSGGDDYPVHNELKEWWFFGFDCGHFGDNNDMWSMNKYGFSIHPYSFFFREGEVRTLEYVVEECYNLADQLNAY